MNVASIFSAFGWSLDAMPEHLLTRRVSRGRGAVPRQRVRRARPTPVSQRARGTAHDALVRFPAACWERNGTKQELEAFDMAVFYVQCELESRSR